MPLADNRNDRAAITLTRLPVRGQRAIARLGDLNAVASLAQNTGIDPDLANQLTRGRNITATRAALRVASDADLVTRTARGAGPNAVAALSNPRVHPDVLIDALTSDNREKILAALCNPSTPEDARRDALTPETAELVCSYGGSTGDRAIRGQVLAHNNPWVADTATAWNTHVRRGIAQFAHISADTVRSITVGPGQRYPGITRHPALTGVDPDALSTQDLLDGFNPALDLIALTRDDATSAQVSDSFVARGNVDELVDFLVLARAVARFGPGVAWDARNHLAGTRRYAAGWAVPSANWAGFIDAGVLDDAQAAVNLLETSDDDTAWETFLRLRDGWTGTHVGLAHAALAL